ncbi:hypothetical protein [Bacillus fonticola]|uniref:hypothetical protein n=1 Tax=Bacillus fonticola TaxID=2728853 RepID=UPI0014744D6E|nr:hypothetical protein [Bacillus fonticola]
MDRPLTGYKRVYRNPYTMSLLHRRSPLIVAWWAAAFPGFGYLLLDKFLSGVILIGWELFMNSFSNLNQAIFYSMVGEIDKAKEVIDIQFISVYIAVYVFGIWDCYRRCVELNKTSYLARFGEKSNEKFADGIEIDGNDKRNPKLAIIWSLLTPGLGHFYCNNMLLAVLGTSLWFLVATKSHVYVAMYYVMVGDLQHSTSVFTVPQWSLFIPSIYIFFAYSAYTQTVELNKLYEQEVSKYLRRHYQPPYFKMPL